MSTISIEMFIVLFETNQFSSGPESDGNKGVGHILQSSCIIGTSPLDCLVSYLGLLLEKSYPLAEINSVYTTALNDWAIELFEIKMFDHLTIFKQMNNAYLNS